jgi:predicted transposase/invertase (TIGR01784 family)
MKMSRDDQVAYDRYLMDRAILRNTMTTARDEGHNEGLAEGLEKGLEKGRAEGRAEGLEKGLEKGRAEGIRAVARKMKQNGLSDADIAQMTGLSNEEVADISL